MKPEELQLDFTTTTPVIDFGDVEEIIVPEKPSLNQEEEEEIKDEGKTVVEEIPELKGKKTAPISDEPEVLELDEDGDFEEQEKSPTMFKKLDAIRAVLDQKLDRYKVDKSDIDLDELDEEALINLEEQIDEFVINSRVQEQWDSIKNADKSLNTLLEYLENGGDIKEISSLFQKQKEINSISIDNEDGQVDIIKSYYSNVLNWDEEKVNKKVDRLVSSGMIKEEAEDVKMEYDKHFEKIQEEKVEEQKRQLVLEEKKLRERMSDFESKLKNEAFTETYKNSLKKVAFDEGIIKETGEKVKILDYRINALKSNPDTFMKLVQFVANPDAYDEYVKQVVKNKTTTEQMKKEFNFKSKTKQPITVDKVKEKPKNYQLKF